MIDRDRKLLQDWLKSTNARQLRRFRMENCGEWLLYQANGSRFVVLEFDRGGFEIYPHASADDAETAIDIAASMLPGVPSLV